MVLKYDSDKEVAFLLSISEGLSLLDFFGLDSIASLNSLSGAISGLFANYWTTYAKRNTITAQSKK